MYVILKKYDKVLVYLFSFNNRVMVCIVITLLSYLILKPAVFFKFYNIFDLKENQSG